MTSAKPRLEAIPSRVITPPKEDLDAEHQDPYAMGWDAGEDLDEPPPCPFRKGLSAQLWRSGFSARVDKYIADVRRISGANASITG